jgi:hypothetical protein
MSFTAGRRAPVPDIATTTFNHYGAVPLLANPNPDTVTVHEHVLIF